LKSAARDSALRVVAEAQEAVLRAAASAVRRDAAELVRTQQAHDPEAAIFGCDFRRPMPHLITVSQSSGPPTDIGGACREERRWPP
jgi:hypothetical protein